MVLCQEAALVGRREGITYGALVGVIRVVEGIDVESVFGHGTLQVLHAEDIFPKLAGSGSSRHTARHADDDGDVTHPGLSLLGRHDPSGHLKQRISLLEAEECFDYGTETSNLVFKCPPGKVIIY